MRNFGLSSTLNFLLEVVLVCGQAKAAAGAEVSIVFAGTISGEGADRSTLALGNIDTNNCRKPCQHTPPGTIGSAADQDQLVRGTKF